MNNFSEFLRNELSTLSDLKLFRTLNKVYGEQGPNVVINGKKVILLSSNNYLGIASHPRIKEVALKATEKYGCGAVASRLISGNSELYEELEDKISSFLRCESSLVFGSGYMANIGLISSIALEGDVIFSDKLNHASIIDGCRLSRAKVLIYPHRDVSFLERLLKSSPGTKKRFIVTEGLFSMEGNLAPLKEIIYLAEKYDCCVIVDDAHAIGVFGESGNGILEHLNLNGGNIIRVGTLSKALGCYGGFIAGSKYLRDYMINRARSFIFTTALPPTVLASAIEAIKIVEDNPLLREKLWKNVKFFRNGLQNIGFNLSSDESQIIPIVVHNPSVAMEMSRMLFEQGIFIQGIRPPTVPKGTSRIRISLMATHSIEELEYSLLALEKTGREFNII